MASDRDCAQKNGTVLFACSGAADVGEIADRAARRLACDGSGTMACLAGVGGRIEGILESAEKASRIVAIDGCWLDCAASTLANAGIDGVEQVRVSDLGLEKGKSPATEDAVGVVVRHVQQQLEGGGVA